MSFIDLQRSSVANSSAPPDGCVVAPMKNGRDRNGATRMAIVVTIGAAVAHRLGLTGQTDTAPMRVQVGSGDDRGRLAIMVDAKGLFTARRLKSGRYRLELPENSFGGRLSPAFEKFTVEQMRVVPGAPGRPTMAIINCPSGMLPALVLAA